MMSDDTPRAAPGALIRGRYRISRQLGQGDVASTWLADDAETGRRCVIKELDIRDAEGWKSLELFQREARVLGNVHHPDIPDFLDHFTVEAPGAVRVYLVQAHVEGESLAHVLRQRRRLPAREVIRIGIGVARILEYLHGLNPPVIHRDIKPSNIMLDAGGRAHLVDFGAVRDTLRPHTDTPVDGDTIVGTYGYMPFEQYAGHAVPASDLFALGMTLVHLISGREPSSIPRMDGRLDLRATGAIPPSLATILGGLLETDLRKRTASATALREALEAEQAGRRHATVVPPRRRALAIATIVAAVAVIAAVSAMRRARVVVDPDRYDIEDHTACGAALRPAPAIGINLVTNPGLEGPCGWVFHPRAAGRALPSGAGTGKGAIALPDEEDKAWQVIDVSALAREISQGGYSVTFSATIRAGSKSDNGNPYLWGYAIRGPNDWVYLSDFPAERGTSWAVRSRTWPLPRATTAIRLELQRTSIAGESGGGPAYFDDVHVVVHRP